jgi:hypothetical protein
MQNSASRCSTISGDLDGAQVDNRANGRRTIEGDQAAQGECHDEVNGGQEKLQALRMQLEMTAGREGSRLDARSVRVLSSIGSSKMKEVEYQEFQSRDVWW